MKAIRNILFKILGIKRFIRFVSKSYLILVRNGFLKSKYPELFYLREIVKPGDTCIDIGANVGYYSYFLSKYSGANGSVHAVEPIPMFGEIWRKNTRNTGFRNLTLHSCALGEKNGTVKMGIPEVNGVLHHGMTKIVSIREENYIEYYDVDMKVPDELFEDLERIDFVKCDVEGYESMVFANMKSVLEKHRPLIQSELGGIENRNKVIKTLEGIGYTTKVLRNGNLVGIAPSEIESIKTDFYFTPGN